MHPGDQTNAGRGVIRLAAELCNCIRGGYDGFENNLDRRSLPDCVIQFAISCECSATFLSVASP